MHHRTAQALFHISERKGLAPRAPLARAAWRALTRGAERGDGNATEAVWRSWLSRCDDETWALLARWRGEHELAEATLAAAVDPERSTDRRSAVGEFCTRRSVLPATDAGRALFYVMTGQLEQLRAADPDGAALAVAYRAAGPAARAAVRDALAGAGDLDAARSIVVVGGGDRSLPSSAEERRYLADRYATDARWRDLWRLLLDLPLAEAAPAARAFPPDRRPDGEAARQLLARLAAASDAGPLSPTLAHLTGRTIGVACGFAPDGSEMVVMWRHVAKNRFAETALHALPGGRQLEVFPEPDFYGFGRRTLHFGAGIVFSYPDHPDSRRLVRYVRGNGTEKLADYDTYESWPTMAWVPGGFVVTLDGRLMYGTAEPGSPLRDVTPAGLNNNLITCVAREPRTGRLVIDITRSESVPDGLLVLGTDFEIVTQREFPAAETRHVENICFCGPGRVVTSHRISNSLRSTAADPGLEADAAVALRTLATLTVQPLPSAGLIVLDVNTEHTREYRDAATLRPVACPAELEWTLRSAEPGRPGRLFLSPDGRHAALSTWRFDAKARVESAELEVRDLVREKLNALIRRPLADMSPADLVAVRDLHGRCPPDQGALAMAGLLRACLEHRFGADVAIGDARAVVSAGDDIALGDDRTR